MKKYKYSALMVVLSMIITSCFPLFTSTIDVSREVYQPNIDKNKFTEYKDTTLIFDSIGIEDPDTNNLYYLSKNKDTAYLGYYKNGGIQQPVVSYFWYTLEKSFNFLGINIETDNLIKNTPRLNIKIKSLTDQEIKYILSLSRNGVLLLQKEVIATNNFSKTNDKDILTKRAYEFIDVIAVSILSDADFRKEYFSKTGRI